jgi:fibronectin-binding autotransporter adhesin
MFRSKPWSSGLALAPFGVALSFCALILVLPAAAETTWDGGGGNESWQSANNWTSHAMPLFNGTETIMLANGFASGPTLNLDGTRYRSISSAANLGASPGSITFGGGTLPITQDILNLLSVNTGNAGTSELFEGGLGKILQNAGAFSGSGDLVRFNFGPLILSGSGPDGAGSTNPTGNISFREAVVFNEANFAFSTGHFELASSNFTGPEVGPVNMSKANSRAGFSFFDADRGVSGGDNVTLSSGSLSGTSTGVLGASTDAIQSGTGSSSFAVTGSPMPDATLATYTWDGGGANNNVTTAQNWVGDVLPGANSDIIWAGTTRLAVNVDVGGPARTWTFDNTAGAFVISGAAFTLSDGITNNSAATQTINNDITLTLGQTWNAASGNLVFGGNIANGGFLLTIGGGSNTSASGIIGGTGGLTKSGAGTLTLSGANSFTGATTVSAGVLNIRNATGVGTTAAGTTVASGAALQLQGGIAVGNETLSLNGTGISNDGALRNISGNNSWAGTITINSTTRINSDSGTLTLDVASGNAITGSNDNLQFGGAGNVTVNDVIATGTGTLTKDGTGTLTLNAANTYTGATTVSAGVLNLQNATGLGTIAAGTTVTSGAALQLQGGVAVGNETLSLDGTGISSDGALRNISGNNSWAGTITINSTTRINSDSGTLTLDVASGNAITGSNDSLQFGGAGNVTINDVIATGTGTLTKDGTGILILNAANTYTGATTVNAGVLNVQNATGLGTVAAGTTVSNGATLQLQGGITVSTEALNIRGTGAGGQTGALVNVSGINNFGGLLTLAGTTTLSSNSGTLNLTNAGTITGATFGLTLTGAGNGSVSSIIGTTSGSLTKGGTGTWTLSSANTFTGATTVNGGTLNLANGTGSALGFTSGIAVNSGGILLLGANNQINNTAQITLNGGTFAKGGFSEGSTNTAGVGALILAGANSHLDFGGTVGSLTFASFNPGGNTLTIDNWSGVANMQGSLGTDRLIFNSDQSGNLGSFNFTGFATGGIEFNLGGGFYEIVPVPETGTYISGLMAFVAILFHHRRQLRGLFRRRSATK